MSILFSGCKYFTRKPKSPELNVVMSLDKPSYLPNEPVISTLRLQNFSQAELKIYIFDIRTVSFYRMNEATGEPLEVMPVYSEKEPLLSVTTLKAKEAMERKFVFTTLSAMSGNYKIQAFFHSSPDRSEEGRATVISNSCAFQIFGEPLFGRDGKGILLKEDAIRIAKEKCAATVRATTATLVINEAGFYDWWVLFDVTQKVGNRETTLKKAYLVNPYLAAVRREVNPSIVPPRKEVEPPVKFRKVDRLSEGLSARPIVPEVGSKKN
jgi:hypothetical protein